MALTGGPPQRRGLPAHFHPSGVVPTLPCHRQPRSERRAQLCAWRGCDCHGHGDTQGCSAPSGFTAQRSLKAHCLQRASAAPSPTLTSLCHRQGPERRETQKAPKNAGDGHIPETGTSRRLPESPWGGCPGRCPRRQGCGEPGEAPSQRCVRGRAEPSGHVPAWQPARLLSASSSPAGFVLTAEQMGEEKKKIIK